jgi:transposase
MLPRRKDQTRRVGRPPQFNRALYHERNRVERAIGRLKEYRRVATRYEKLADNYLAAVDIACLHILLREIESSVRP